jgi:hypothetical protein
MTTATTPNEPFTFPRDRGTFLVAQFEALAGAFNLPGGSEQLMPAHARAKCVLKPLRKAIVAC